MIPHDEALDLLKQHAGDAIVVAVYGTAVDWHALRPHPLNYFSVGAMGLAASHGLGLALGRPDQADRSLVRRWLAGCRLLRWCLVLGA